MNHPSLKGNFECTFCRAEALHVENNMASLKHIGTIESDDEIHDYESEGSVKDDEKVEYCFRTWFYLLLHNGTRYNWFHNSRMNLLNYIDCDIGNICYFQCNNYVLWQTVGFHLVQFFLLIRTY